MLVEASEVPFASSEQDLCTPKDAVEIYWLHNFFWQNKVFNLKEISLEDANVTYFDNGYIGYSICWRRKHTGCKVLLLADNERQEQNKEIFLKTICFFLTILIDVCLPLLSCAPLLQLWLCKLTMLFYQIARFKSIFWHLINSDVFLLKRCCVFLLHQLLPLKRVVPKTMKTLH